jgi:hypothetical protein
MTGRPHRLSVPDRARKRAIRALATRLGVSYMVAARLLRAQLAGSCGGGGAPKNGPHGSGPTGADEHRAWLFAMRERRSFDLRVRDTRLATDVPLGRAAHLAERFPRLRQPGVEPLYDGDGRQALLAMVYAVLVYESPALLPPADELAWVAELGEETAVDFACAALDRAARLLLDVDRWRLWTRIEAALAAGEASRDRRLRDPAITLGGEFRTVILRGSLAGTRQTLDALLVAAHGGHAPGVRVLALGQAGTVVGVRWTIVGPPTGYEVKVDAGATIDVDDVTGFDQSVAPEPAST